MSGIAMPYNPNKSFILSHEADLDNIQGKMFYGFRFSTDGRLTVDVLGSGDTIRLPDVDQDTPCDTPSWAINKKEDYFHWLWTNKTVEFSWDNSNSSHLLLEVK